MYIQNRHDTRNFKYCSPLENCNGLLSLKPEIVYLFIVQIRWQQASKNKFK